MYLSSSIDSSASSRQCGTHRDPLFQFPQPLLGTIMQWAESVAEELGFLSFRQERIIEGCKGGEWRDHTFLWKDLEDVYMDA